jgi:hypothetical protein
MSLLSGWGDVVVESPDGSDGDAMDWAVGRIAKASAAGSVASQVDGKRDMDLLSIYILSKGLRS